MVIDKKRAQKDGWRIPEKNMFVMAVLGGGLGGLCAMVFKRHKNRHMDFILVFTMTAILHMVAAFLLVGTFVRDSFLLPEFQNFQFEFWRQFLLFHG